MITRRELMIALAAPATAADASAYDTPHKYGRLILAADADPKAFDSRSVDCPFVFCHRGQYYMTYVGFDGTGYQTGLASSSDLVNWKKLGCILRRDQSNPITRYNVALNWILRDSLLRSRGDLKKVGGRYLGVFHAYPNPGYEAGAAVIGLCWSTDLMKWELGDICLRPEEGSNWGNGGLYKPCLVEHNGTYYLFYNAKTREKRWHEQTGVATSTDLKTWRRYAANPILRNGPAGSWDERFASDPCVLLDDSKWVMFYFGLDAKGVARDLIAVGDGPFQTSKLNRILIDVGPPGSVDSTYAHKPSVIWRDKAVYHFYCAVSGRWPNEVRGISVASSRPWT